MGLIFEIEGLQRTLNVRTVGTAGESIAFERRALLENGWKY